MISFFLVIQVILMQGQYLSDNNLRTFLWYSAK